VSDEWVKAVLAEYLPATETLLQSMGTRITSEANVVTPQLSTSTDSAWAGYVREAPSGSSQLFAQDDVNAVAEPSGAAQMGSWGGIGGYGNGTVLFQSGIDDSTLRPFWEIVPRQNGGCGEGDPDPNEDHPCEYPNFVANSGDSIESDIAYDSSTGDWMIAVGDTTTGQWWSNEFGGSPTTSTAEWITEDASGNQGPPNVCCYYHSGQFSETSNGSMVFGADQQGAPGQLDELNECITPTGLYTQPFASGGTNFTITQGSC
jgi:hypothetical protein